MKPGRKRRKMTAGTEACLLAIASMNDQQLNRLKMCTLARAAGVGLNTARRACNTLSDMDLIARHRERQGGPDASYSFTLKPRGRNLANLLKAAQYA